MDKPDKIQLREAVDLSAGRDEMNLSVLPVCSLAFTSPKREKTCYYEREDKVVVDGAFIPHSYYMEITGSDLYGLPTYSGIEVILACLKVSHDQGFSQTFETSMYRLLQILRWDKSLGKNGRGCDGHQLKRLERSLDQLIRTSIKTNYFWDKTVDMRRDTAFTLLSDYDFPKDRKHPGKISWGNFFMKCLKADNTKKLNLDTFFSLSGPISKETFRYADRKLLSHQSHQRDAFDFVSWKLGMTSDYYKKRPDMALAKLKPVIREWKEKRILGFDIKQSKTKSKYKVVFWKFRKKQIAVTEELPKEAVEVNPDTQKQNDNPQPDFNLNNEAHLVLSQFNLRTKGTRLVDLKIIPFIEKAIQTNGLESCYDNDDLIIEAIKQAQIAYRN